MSAACEAGITSFAVSENTVSRRAKYLSSMRKGKCEEGDCPYIAPWSAKQWNRSLQESQMSVPIPYCIVEDRTNFRVHADLCIESLDKTRDRRFGLQKITARSPSEACS
jgi:hypothetical protein